MIQIKRGKTSSWRKLKQKLHAGQPGYDKDKHKIKIGDGKQLWSELPYASGLFDYEIFNSERVAKERLSKDSEDITIITHGKESPDKDTVGQVYLQCYEAEPEVDYVVEAGVDNMWTYRKWHSGKAECWGALDLITPLQSAFENGILFHNNIDMKHIDYPLTFTSVPVEGASVQSTGNIVWLAGKSNNTKNTTGQYLLISPYKCESAKYKVVLHVNGYWK